MEDNVLIQILFDDLSNIDLLVGQEFGILTNKGITDDILRHLDFSQAGDYWNAWVTGGTLYVGVNDNDNAVPEPAAWVLLMLGILGGGAECSLCVKEQVSETTAGNAAKRSDRIDVASDFPLRSGHCASLRSRLLFFA